jgi:hypothetical protein
MQGNGQGGRCRALLFVHGLAEGARLGDRAGHVEQHQHRQITTPPQVVQVDGFVRRRPGE